ncbi:hypothetical protein A2957_00375 [Candidatus Roizmanbacteria bacterium RIFCSPLOWO2_01_FULL_38_11]|uniref:Glycosyltransferase 2-like domain-containing protein n=1 Tax=Candidatus Roizmanbacteria bacterium RIFCSPLOWO2_01_FULL_38_11 TaxID=1802060 RepID=A0A1F7IK41_9BACT|nr:MAG: hypothetical protein A2957_00375 [Candidatus Roizmanbacteria bacterium RIFCSPLOWO2_01_FULL_38_11]
MTEDPDTLPTHEVLHPDSIAIFTTTYYPEWYPGKLQDHREGNVDKIRGDLAIQTVMAARQKGHQLVIIDGGSSADFCQMLTDQGITPSPERERGMSASRRQGMSEATNLQGAEILCWVEPEKLSFVTGCLPIAAQPIAQGEADIVIPQRDEAAFGTYPDYQVVYEQRANRAWNKLLRIAGLRSDKDNDLDAWFGPRVLRNAPEVVECFLGKYEVRPPEEIGEISETSARRYVKPELWPNSTFLPIITALHKGLRVVGQQVPYRHPAEQTQSEQDSPAFIEKRKLQYFDILVSTIHYIHLLQSNPRTILR